MRLKNLLTALGLLLVTLGCQAGNTPEYTVVSQEESLTFTGQAIYAAKDMVYVGELKNGQRHGYGVTYGKIGTVMAGNWKDDKFVGQGVIVSYDVNSVSAGNFDGGTLVGDGVLTFDGDVVKGTFKKGAAEPDNAECFRSGKSIPCETSIPYQ